MGSGGVQIRVSDMLFALQKRWKMILSLTLVGLVFGVVLFAMTYVKDSIRSFEVSGSVSISTQNHSDGVYINGSQIANNNDFHLAEDMVDSVVYVLRSNTVLKEVIERQGLLGTTVDDLRNELTLSQYEATQIIEIHFTWSTAEEAQNIWQCIIDVANEIIPETLQLGQLAIVNPPEVVESTAASSGRILPILLMLLGFFAGVGVALTELIIRPTLTNPRDAETMFGLETIGIIPRDENFFRRHQGSLLTGAASDHSEVLQNYSAAAYILRNRLSTKEQHHCFYVTSTTTGEGKSTVAANLAIQLSDMEHRTLLIDFDTRNPSLGTLFMDKVDYAHSLNALYRGDAIEEDAITPLTGYLDLLPAVLEHNAIVLDGTVTDMIQRLSDKYEYIILDTSPVGEASETLSLNRVANTVLYVIEYDSTPLPQIQTSLEKLDKSGIRVLGCVINGVGKANSKGKEEKRRSNALPARQSNTVFVPSTNKIVDVKPKAEAKPVKAAKPVKQEPKKEKASRSAGLGVFKRKESKPAGKHAKHAKGASVEAEQPIANAMPEAEATVTAPVENVAAPVIETERVAAVPEAPTLRTEQRRNVLSDLMSTDGPVDNENRSTQSVLDDLMQMGSNKSKH